MAKDRNRPDPDGRGHAQAGWLRCHAAIRAAETDGRRVPIIMLTAEADVGERVKGLRAGADDDIVKPFHPLELMARIKALLARGGSLPTAAGAEAHDAGPAGGALRRQGWRGHDHHRHQHGHRHGSRAAAPHRADRREPAVRRPARVPGPGLDTASIVNAVSEPDLRYDLLRKLIVRHHSGVDLLLAPPSPEAADIVMERQRTDPTTVSTLLNLFRKMYDYTFVDMVKTIDDFNLQLFDEADVIFVIMTADLSCLKNVRSVLETMDHLGYEKGKVQLVLNRSNAYTGINVNNAESALARKVDYQIINEYRGAISALNSGEPFMSSRPDGPLGRSVADFATQGRRAARRRGRRRSRLSAPSAPR